MALLYYVVHTMYYALCSTIILPALQACYDLLEKNGSSVPTKTDVVDHAASFFSKKKKKKCTAPLFFCSDFALNCMKVS